MVTVNYHHEIQYTYENGRHYPRLTLRLANLGDPEQAIDLDAYLDSGAERSLFSGCLAPVVESTCWPDRFSGYNQQPGKLCPPGSTLCTLPTLYSALSP